MTVYIVIFDKAAYRISSKLFSDIASYIDDHYVETHINKTSEAMRRQKQFREMDLCESISLPEPSNVPLILICSCAGEKLSFISEQETIRVANPKKQLVNRMFFIYYCLCKRVKEVIRHKPDDCFSHFQFIQSHYLLRYMRRQMMLYYHQKLYAKQT